MATICSNLMMTAATTSGIRKLSSLAAPRLGRSGFIFRSRSCLAGPFSSNTPSAKRRGPAPLWSLSRVCFASRAHVALPTAGAEQHIASPWGSCSSKTLLWAVSATFLSMASGALFSCAQNEELDEGDTEEETTMVLNWSGTHSVDVPTINYHEPESVKELLGIMKRCAKTNTSIRPVGSALSPNGLAFDRGGMVSLANLDKIVSIDEENMTVTVQAGARVSQVVDALRPHGMTLPNLASIAEQQVGGFIQVGAHGTGALIPPVDDFVTSLKMVTPACGMVKLKRKRDDGTDDPIFHVAKVGLGCLGIVTEVTMKCIPAHRLVEHTYVLTRREARNQLETLLQEHKHVRYMWIPYEDAVVVVTNDPEEKVSLSTLSHAKQTTPVSSEAKKKQFEPLTDLLQELSKRGQEAYSEEMLLEMGFGEIRDALLATDPLDVNHVKRCNKAEAEFWRRSEGYQIKPSDQLLQFDCGGQQWVWEVCFPTGSYGRNNGNDILFMEKLLAGIDEKKIAAHSPIEQRWSASSSSFMSPAFGPPEGLHSWVGIIMYLPTDEECQRRDITNAFRAEYCDLVRKIGQETNAVSHWAKLEMPQSEAALRELQKVVQSRYPVQLFNFARYTFDPKGLLSNDLMDAVFGNAKRAS